MSKASLYIKVDNINGEHGTKELKRELGILSGVTSVSVNDKTECIAIDYDTTGVKQEQLMMKIEKLGYDIAQVKLENHIM